MHELSLARAVVEQLAEQAAVHGFTRVVRVKLAIGALGHVDPEALAFGFDVVAEGTLAEGAALEIEQPEGAAHCLGCGAHVTIRSRADLCPVCGGADLVVTGGGDMKIREMEVA
jgi:hydrogenase nickel incorporation protein HypA/HybF